MYKNLSICSGFLHALSERVAVLCTDLNMSPEGLGGRRGGLMVSALNSGVSAPGLSPGQGHCVVFLGKTLYSHGASLHPGV